MPPKAALPGQRPAGGGQVAPRGRAAGVKDGSPAMPQWSLKEEEEQEGEWRGSPPPIPAWDTTIAAFEVKLTDVRSLSWGSSEQGWGSFWAGPLGRGEEPLTCGAVAQQRSKQGPFVCGACGKAFWYRLNLLAHKKRRGKCRPSCAPCGLQFCLKGDLLRHQAGHVAKGPNSGPTCGLAFKHRRRLQAHEARHEATVAPECGQACVGEAELQRQQAATQEDRPFVCPTCRASFSWKESLQIHQRLHTQERAFACPLCGRTFSRQGNLLAHQRLHTGELPFACPDCGRRFLSQANLAMHRRQPGRCLQGGCRSPEGLLEHRASSHSPGEVGVQAEAVP